MLPDATSAIGNIGPAVWERDALCVTGTTVGQTSGAQKIVCSEKDPCGS